MVKNKLIDYPGICADLIKYRLSLVVTVSAITGYFLFRNSIDRNFFSLIPGLFFLASGASVLNQYIEREQDVLMDRTMSRPIPAGKISLRNAVVLFSILLISGSLFLLNIGLVPFILGAGSVILYDLIYTPLKKVTALAILPGALTGAIPPVIGYTSAGGSIMNEKILWFSVYMFIWQLPHFWLLIIRYGKEYQAAGFRTPLAFLTENEIRWFILFWILLSSGFLAWFLRNESGAGSSLTISVLILNLAFILFFFKYLFVKRDPGSVSKAFILLNSFVLLVMIILIADSLVNTNSRDRYSYPSAEVDPGNH